MSVHTASDSAMGVDGSVGQGSPSVPNYAPAQMPTDGAVVATDGQTGDASMPVDAAEGMVFSEDDIAFLQSDEVRNWLEQNKPQGFWTEAEFQQHKRSLQETLNQQANARLQDTERRYQDQLTERETQRNLVISALEQSWREQGLDPNSEDWNQRVAALRNALNSEVNTQKVQRYEQHESSRKAVAERAAMVAQRFATAGIPLAQHPNLTAYTRDYLTRFQSGEFQSEFAAQQALDLVLQQARQSLTSQPVAQPQAPQTAVVQPQATAPARPTPGPMRTVRGGGGGVPRSSDQLYSEGKQRLAQQYGGELNIPLEELRKLDIEVEVAAWT